MDADHPSRGVLFPCRNTRNAVLTQDHLDAIDGLGLNNDDAGALKNAAVQLQLLSDPDSFTASSGPFQSVARGLSGHLGGMVVGGLTGGYHGAGIGYLVGGAVRPVVRGTMESLGAGLDGVVGFGRSTLQRSADDGRALLRAAGVPVPNATDDLQAAVMQTRSAIARQRALIAGGLSPTLQSAANRATIAPTVAQATQGSPTTPTQAPDVVAAAIARAAAQGQPTGNAAGSGGTSGAVAPGTYAPDVSGLSQDALTHAARLPAWVYGLGANLQDALHVSGQARPVNMAAEVNDALNRLQDRRWLPDDIVEGLKTHSGRIVPQLYELLRNEMLLHNGIDRTVGGVAMAGQQATQQQ